MKHALALILVTIGLSTANAMDALQKRDLAIETCVSKLRAVVSSEDAPAVVEACYEPRVRSKIAKCKDAACVLGHVDLDGAQ